MNTNTGLPAGGALSVGAGGRFIFDPSITSSPLAVNDSAGGVAVQAVPEPASLVLLLAFAGFAAGTCWRRRARQVR